MAYNSVATPRFYVDELQYVKSIGLDLEKVYSDLGYTDDLIEAKTVLTDPGIFNFEPEIQKKVLREQKKNVEINIKICNMQIKLRKQYEYKDRRK